MFTGILSLITLVIICCYLSYLKDITRLLKEINVKLDKLDTSKVKEE